MPLVIPGIQSNNDNKSGISKDEWQNKLAGKLLGEKHDEITFAKTDLPKNHRVLKPDSMKTMNYDENRLNIHLDAEDRVHEVTTG